MIEVTAFRPPVPPIESVNVKLTYADACQLMSALVEEVPFTASKYGGVGSRLYDALATVGVQEA